MSFLDTVSSLVGQTNSGSAAQPTADQHVSVTQALLQHFNSQPGGLGGLLDQFRQNGMSGHVDSWLSPTPNQPVQPQQVEQSMGSQQISSIAERAGISPELAKMALAAALPLLISHLSQGSGKLPEQGTQPGGLAGLASSLFSRAL